MRDLLSIYDPLESAESVASLMEQGRDLMQQGAELLIKEAAVKLAAKMHFTDTAIMQVAEL